MTQNMSIPKRRVIAINASGGGGVTIKSTIFCRYVEIQECPPDAGGFSGAFTAQGLEYSQPDNPDVIGLPVGGIIALGDRNAPRNRSVGSVAWTDAFGQAAGGTVLVIGVVSATATATHVEVREWP